MIKHIKKLHKYSDASRVLVLCMLIALGSVIGNNKMFADEETGTASMQIVAPFSEENTYTVDIYLAHFLGEELAGAWVSEPLISMVEVYVDEVLVENTFTAAPWDSPYASDGFVLSQEVAAGSIITLKNVPMSGDDGWGGITIDGAKVTTVITSSEATEKIELVDGGVSVLSTETEALMYQIVSNSLDDGTEEPLGTKPTDETYLSQSGYSYDLEYLLSHYNVISREDIASIHIVGPVIAQDSVYYYANDNLDGSGFVHNSSSSISVADYSRGVVSYIGNLFAIGDSELRSSVILEYAYDYTYASKVGASFSAPTFFTSLTDQEVFLAPFGEEKLWTVKTDGQTFLSPSAEGRGADILQNDTFINFDELYNSIIQQSTLLGQEGSVEGQISSDNYHVIDSLDDFTQRDDYAGKYILRVNMEESYYVTEEMAKYLDVIDAYYPDDYDETTNPYVSATTITVEGDNLPQTGVLNGETYSIFPDTLIEGKELSITSQGEGFEYGEQGNQLIYNLPSVTGPMITGGSGQNIPGHIVAPKADFYNYALNWNLTEITGWEGGNINGCSIFNSFHGGQVETHMFPYTGLEMQHTQVVIEGNKVLEGTDLENYEFEFELNLTEGNASDFKDGTFPAKVTHDAQGNFVFDAIDFSKVGTYKFTVSEVVTDIENIVYDLSVYEITVVLTIDQTTGVFDAEVVTTKIVDSTGESLGQGELAESITFVNEYEEPEIPLDPDFVLPNTGGLGTYTFYLLGTMFIGLSFILRKKSNRGGN